MNVLLNEARKDYRKNKYKEIEASMSSSMSDLKIDPENESFAEPEVTSDKDDGVVKKETEMHETRQSKTHEPNT